MNNSFFTPNQLFYPNQMQENDTIEGILKRVPAMKIKVYMTFPGSNEWRDRIFEGLIEAAGRDHMVVSDPRTGAWYVLPNIYVDYVEFEESIQNYIRNS